MCIGLFRKFMETCIVQKLGMDFKICSLNFLTCPCLLSRYLLSLFDFFSLTDTNELKIILQELKHRVGEQSARLLRQLKQRDRLLHKVQRDCDVVTACLQAVSQKRSECHTGRATRVVPCGSCHAVMPRGPCCWAPLTVFLNTDEAFQMGEDVVPRMFGVLEQSGYGIFQARMLNW